MYITYIFNIFNNDCTQQTWTAYKNGENKLKCDFESTELNYNYTKSNKSSHNNLEQVEIYLYLGSILNDKFNYDEQCGEKS
jgi:hypothetical protein